MTSTLAATTWDIVCAANQKLRSANRPITINQFMPGVYEIVCLNEQGATTGRRAGKKMDEETVREFVKTVVFA